ncbi:MAG: hypothetical protein ABW168_03010 [Sedimenticola sp.]
MNGNGIYSEDIPSFTDKRQLKMVWVNHRLNERAFIYQTTQGYWGMWGEYFSEHEAEMCWCGDDMGGHIFDSEDTATKELKAAHPWAKEIELLKVES